MRLILEIPDHILTAASSAPGSAESAGGYGGVADFAAADAFSAGPAPYITGTGSDGAASSTAPGGEATYNRTATSADGDTARDGGPAPS
ncbi:hypothetical protein [Streptomyces sp. NPDC001076]